jgi:transposase
MAGPYAQDLRDRVLAAYDRGMPTKQIADLFQVSPAWARRVKQRRREHNQTTPRPMGGVRIVKIDVQQLKTLVRQHPDATLKELRDMLGVDCGESGIWMALNRIGWSFKKKRFTRRSRIGPTSPPDAPTGGINSRVVTPGV